MTLCLRRNCQSPLNIQYYLLFSGTTSWFSKLYPSYQYSPFSAPSSLYFSYGSSHLFISVTITTTNVLTDLLALQWEVKPQRERVSASVRERERQSHPPTQKPCTNNCTLCSQIMWDAWFPIQPRDPLLTHTFILFCRHCHREQTGQYSYIR